LPIIDEEGNLEGVITKKNTVNSLTQSKIKLDEKIKKIITIDYKKLNLCDPIKYLTRSLIRWNQILVENNKLKKFFLASHDDLLNNYMEKEDAMGTQ
jgi:predicted transcriptional regulator